MLRVFHSLKELDFEKLMAVYEEGNLENGQKFWPDAAPCTSPGAAGGRCATMALRR